MNPRPYASALFSSLLLVATAVVSYAGGGGGPNTVTKTAVYIQKNSTGAVASPLYPYDFSAKANSSATLAGPSSASDTALPYNSNDSQYELDEKFATKSALDATFPDGTYQMTGGTISGTASFPLSPDSYPAAIPYLTSGSSGTWSGGVLFINPSLAATLDLSAFSDYTSSPVSPVVGYYMEIDINDISGGSTELSQTQLSNQSAATAFSVPYSSTPFTSYSIPSSTLTPGHIYEVDLQYAAALTFSATPNPIVSLFENSAVAYVVASSSPGTAPVLASDLTSVTGLVGGNVTLADTVTVGGSTPTGTFVDLWYDDGEQLNIDGVHYVSTTNSSSTQGLTINTLTTADAGTYFMKFIGQGGLVTTSEATLTVLPADAATVPTISSHSGTTGTVNNGSALDLSVTASDVDTNLALTYQWQLNSVNISGATGSTYSVASVSTNNTGDYSVIVSNGYATINHDFGTLTVNPFTLQPPTALTLQSGRSLALNVIASGASAASYQWYFNNNSGLISGATDPVLEVKNTTLSSAGNYYCVATIGGVQYTSTSTALTVTTSSTPAYLSALSTRGDVGTGNDILIGGFAINGTGTKQLLLRAVGPALVNDSLPLNELLASTQLALYDSTGHPIVTDAGWNNAFTPGTSAVVVDPVAATADFIASLGDTPAFAAGSTDSAMVVSAPAGDATALVSGVNGATGIALVEIYDGDTEPAPTHLAAISTRGNVGTGGNILIGGLAIGGNTAETVLIQAVGPSLNGVTGTLTQPVLTIYSGSTVIYANTGWGGDPTIAGVETTVGSTSLVSTNADSALLVTLPPGGYTAEVSGLNSGTGIALIEIYEVP